MLPMIAAAIAAILLDAGTGARAASVGRETINFDFAW